MSSNERTIALLIEQVESRNAEIILRRVAMNKAVNMLKSNDCANQDVIDTLVAGM